MTGIILSVNLIGSHKPTFIKDKSGKLVRVFDRSSELDCTKRISLGEAFIKYASSNESIPRDKRSNARYRWKSMSNRQRIEYHIIQLVKDFSNLSRPERNKDYSFEILK